MSIENRAPTSRRRKRGLTLTPGGCIVLLLVNLLVLMALAWPILQARLALLTPTPVPSATLAPTSSATPAPTATATHTPSPTAVLTAAPSSTPLALPPLPNWSHGALILSIQEGAYHHLFAYQPPWLPLTRLTNGTYDDITPAVSPDGHSLAFASNRDGQWDLYRMDLTNGEVTRLTDTPFYEAAPSWSPDGLWLVYEAYVDDNLDLFIRSADGTQEPIRLTTNPAADYAPVWSPLGRQIAFVSDRAGQADIWLADLDAAPEDRFVNLSQTHDAQEASPTWAPDGHTLAWARRSHGLHEIVRWSAGGSPLPVLGSGDLVTWSTNGEALAAVVETPGETLLTAYSSVAPGVALPTVPLPGRVYGMTWTASALPDSLLQSRAAVAALTPTPLWQAALTPDPALPPDRIAVVPLPDVAAPFPRLSDRVDEAFAALRQAVIAQLAWDFLSTLENAYVPLTMPLDPGLGQDWLYTGRAFAVNTQAMSAGWMVAVREDFGSETYWRLYVRARLQDGSLGRPLRERPWDFTARDDGDLLSYESGGALADRVPPGYWVDFTALATAFGWQRQPALLNWRTYFPGTRLNEYALTEGLTWQAAMTELFPPEILVTPTPVPTTTP